MRCRRRQRRGAAGGGGIKEPPEVTEMGCGPVISYVAFVRILQLFRLRTADDSDLAIEVVPICVQRNSAASLGAQDD